MIWEIKAEASTERQKPWESGQETAKVMLTPHAPGLAVCMTDNSCMIWDAIGSAGMIFRRGEG